MATYTPLASTPVSRSRGRPRGFDETAAIEAAMRIFWMRGYDQASVDTLCQTMEMPRASLYHLFDGKEGLFLAAIAHYAETRLRPVAEALVPNGSLRDDLGAFFRQVVGLATCDPETPGCLVSCVLLDAAATNMAFRSERDRHFDALEDRIAQRLLADNWSQGGRCPTNVAAALTATMARGIVLRARSGQGADQLHPVGFMAVEALMGLRG